MKLTVKFIDACAVPGGKAVALCDERGEVLPCQIRAILDNGIDRARITVEFCIDGHNIALVENGDLSG